MRLSRLFLLLLIGCGGRAEDGAAGPTTDTATNSSAASGCPAGCDHMQSCSSEIDRAQCTQACERDFARAPTSSPDVWGACIVQLSCEDIRRGIQMDYGPIGACYTKAQGQR